MRVCDMDLKVIDVSSNPVTYPPIETCERGICSMRRYWHCIRMEQQSKKKAMDEVQKKLQQKTKKSYNRFLSGLKKCPSKTGSPALSSLRKTSIGITTESSTASAPPSLPPSSRSTSLAQQKPSNFATLSKGEKGDLEHCVSEPFESTFALLGHLSPPALVTSSSIESPKLKRAPEQTDSKIHADKATVDPIDGSSVVAMDEDDF